MKIIHRFTILIFLSGTTLFANQQLLGTWNLIQIQNGEQLIFDANDPGIIASASLFQKFQINPEMTKRDSSKVIRESKKMHKLFSRIFFSFQADGKLLAGQAEQTHQGYEFKIEEGIYSVNGNQLNMQIGQQINVYQFNMEDQVLVCRQIIGGVISDGFLVFKSEV